jgi:Na+/H+ antiporter NhaD/arsenite permease-like protein
MVVTNLRLAGFFGLCHAVIASRAHRPAVSLIGVTAIAGILSAGLVNDTVCVMLTPLVIDTARGLRRKPGALSLGAGDSVQCRGSAAMTGNPQNMMTGSISGIAYGDFAATRPGRGGGVGDHRRGRCCRVATRVSAVGANRRRVRRSSPSTVRSW